MIISGLDVGDFGCALAHRAAWKAVMDGPHEWVIILEDDTQLVSKDLLTEFPLVAWDCDFVMMNPLTHSLVEPVCRSSFRCTSPLQICEKTTVVWDHWGYGGIGYLVHKEGAKKLYKNSDKVCVLHAILRSHQGFNTAVDGHIWYFNQGCLTKEMRVTHYPASRTDTKSVRQFLNGMVNTIDES
jgi:GR25 family glycosyltransferase involved in LPS biosynthesis